jgi:hypothetical protein
MLGLQACTTTPCSGLSVCALASCQLRAFSSLRLSMFLHKEVPSPRFDTTEVC